MISYPKRCVKKILQIHHTDIIKRYNVENNQRGNLMKQLAIHSVEMHDENGAGTGIIL